MLLNVYMEYNDNVVIQTLAGIPHITRTRLISIGNDKNEDSIKSKIIKLDKL